MPYGVRARWRGAVSVDCFLRCVDGLSLAPGCRVAGIAGSERSCRAVSVSVSYSLIPFLLMMKYLLLLLFCPLLAWAQQADKRQRVRLETDRGNITIALYDETPGHRDNFLRLVREGFYDSLLFHRVIEDFMIQTGDPDSRKAQPGAKLGDGGPGYDLPAEICLPKLFHRRGAVAAARESDDVNPERRSSGSQFYIVWGRMGTPKTVGRARQQVEKATGGRYTITDEMEETYCLYGGTPHLDGAYTFIGEVVEGLDDVVYAIQMETTDDNDRPFADVRILRAVVLEPQP